MYDEITSQSFHSEVLDADTPVLLDFFADWCTPCRMLSAVLERISEDYDGLIRICRVNVDRERALAKRYNIYEVPTVIFFKNGWPTDRFIGFRNSDEIEAMISRK